VDGLLVETQTREDQGSTGRKGGGVQLVHVL
jgi:hypothetical protein